MNKNNKNILFNFYLSLWLYKEGWWTDTKDSSIGQVKETKKFLVFLNCFPTTKADLCSNKPSVFIFSISIFTFQKPTIWLWLYLLVNHNVWSSHPPKWESSRLYTELDRQPGCGPVSPPGPLVHSSPVECLSLLDTLSPTFFLPSRLLLTRLVSPVNRDHMPF